MLSVRSGNQVVQRYDAVSLIQQVIAHVRADKTGASRDHITQKESSVLHGTFSPELYAGSDVAGSRVVTDSYRRFRISLLAPVRSCRKRSFEAQSRIRGLCRTHSANGYAISSGKYCCRPKSSRSDRCRASLTRSCSGDFWRLRWSRSTTSPMVSDTRCSRPIAIFGDFYFGFAALVCSRGYRIDRGLGNRRFIVQPKWLGAVSKESGSDHRADSGADGDVSGLVCISVGMAVRRRVPIGGYTRLRCSYFFH